MKIDDYELLEDLYYAKYHVWAKVEDNLVRIGITDFMQRHAGKITYFSPRPVGTRVERGKPLGTIESGKWVGPVLAPLTGTIQEVNGNLKTNVSLIHSDPYGEGWMVIIKPERLEEDLKVLFHRESAVKWYTEDIERYKKTGELPKL